MYLDAISVDAASEILLNFYFVIPSEVLDTISRVVVSEAPNEVTMKNPPETFYDEYTREELIALYSEDDDSYVLSRGIAAGEMTGEVTVTFFDNSENGGKKINIHDYVSGEVKDHVVRMAIDYPKRMLGRNNAKLKAMCTAMVTFGGYAQTYFGVSGTGLAYEVLDEFDIDVPDLSTVDTSGVKPLEKSGRNIGLTYNGQKVILDSVISLKTYFKLDKPMTLAEVKRNYTFELSVENDNFPINNRLVIDEENGEIVVRIEEIPPAYWDREYKITITKKSTGETYQVTSTVNAYIDRMIKSSKDENLKNVLKSMYLYNQAANAWFNK